MIIFIGLVIIFLTSIFIAPHLKHTWIIYLVISLYTIICLAGLWIFDAPEPTHEEYSQIVYLYGSKITIDEDGIIEFTTVSSLDEIEDNRLKSNYATIEFHEIGENENPYIKITEYSYKGSIYYWFLTFVHNTKIEVYSNLPVSRF